jgi:NADPH-dependent glutamate synthase beta subunit-like oxidoreductase/dihydroorotate dehydrogenase
LPQVARKNPKKFTDFDIPIEVAGVKFRNPFIVASGPTTSTIEQLRAAEENGWGAASLKLTLVPTPYINRKPRYGYYNDQGYLAFTAEKRLEIDDLLRLIEQARKECPNLILFSNITYTGEDIEGWIKLARDCENAGVHINELNMGCPNMSFNVEMSGDSQGGPKTGASLGCNAVAASAIVKEVKENSGVPVFLKLCPEGGQIRHVAKAAFAAGADCVGSNANRLAVVPLNLEDPAASTNLLQKEIGLSCMSGEWVLPLAKRDCYEIRRMVGTDPYVFACGGVSEWQHAVEMAMCGADLVGICTATLTKGFGFMPEFIHHVKTYMKDHGYETFRDMRDIVVQEIKSAPELTIFEGQAELKDTGLSAPCVYNCPAHVPAQGYVRAVADEDFETAYKLICSKNPLQSICGKICDHPCEEACTRASKDEALRIRDIKDFVLNHAKEQGWDPIIDQNGTARGQKVAVVGSGPAGLAAAYDLARAGYGVTVFEREAELGGALRSFIPMFRMGKQELDADIEMIKGLGVEMKTGVEYGKDVTAESLKAEGYAALFLGVGAWLAGTPGIAGEDADGCLTAIDLLKDAVVDSNQFVGKSVGIIGGGFTAVDAARTCARLGASEVYILYRRTKDEMPATPEEIDEAEEEGVKVMYLVSPKEVLTQDGAVAGLRMVNHVLGKQDDSVRPRPETVEGTEFTLALNNVIFAVSQKVDAGGLGDLAVERGFITIDRATGRTNIDGVYAGGDCCGGRMDVIAAVADAKRAAVAIDQDLAGDAAFLKPEPAFTEVKADDVLAREGEDPRRWRIPVERRAASDRRQDWGQYRDPLTMEQAIAEAERCYGCGCGAGCQICEQLCMAFCYKLDDDFRIETDQDKCVACAMCIWRCPNANIEMKQTSEEPV